jgi:hypothetical protein
MKMRSIIFAAKTSAALATICLGVFGFRRKATIGRWGETISPTYFWKNRNTGKLWFWNLVTWQCREMTDEEAEAMKISARQRRDGNLVPVK